MKRALAHRRLPPLLLVVLCAQLAATVPARAETLRYTIDLPAGEPVTYEIELEVRHPGTLAVQAEWSGKRSLSLRLVPPDTPRQTLHRAGKSPQLLEAVAGEGKLGLGKWTLRVYSLAAGEAGTGVLAIELPEPQSRPEPTRPDAAREARGSLPETPAPSSEPWMSARPVPPGTPGRFVPFLEATERLRSAVMGDDPAGPPSDVCQWQAGMLRYLVARGDALVDGGAAPTGNTGDLLGRMARAVESVEELRVSDDPLVAGPAPRDARMREAWRKLRTTRLEPVETELDRILSMLRRGFAPELGDQEWPARYVSCLTASERYFEQRVRVGDERARNRELALTQWPTILLAADALAALAELSPTADPAAAARARR